MLSGSNIISQTTGDETLIFLYDGNGELTGFRKGTESYYYLKNLQGDIMQVTDDTGNVVVSYSYDDWGYVTSITGSQASTIGEQNPFRYRGYYYDSETSLYYLNSRYYDPETGRFINADELLNIDSLFLGCNVFAYCECNPISSCDIDGRNPVALYFLYKLAKAAIIAIGVVVTTIVVADVVDETAKAVRDAVDARSAKKTENYNDQSVYIKRNQEGNVEYVGRTNDPERRDAEHGRDPSKSHLQPMEVLYTGLTVKEARLMEQILISAYITENISNARREIAVGKLGKYNEYMELCVILVQNVCSDELYNMISLR